MYIIHETLSDHDPRIDSRTTLIGDYWHFTVRYIPDESVYLDWLLYEEISEPVAKSYKITKSYKGVISISEPVTNIDEITQVSADTEYKKYIYELTDTDKSNVTELMKASMRLYAKARLQNPILEKLLVEVDLADSIERCEYVMHHYYGVGSATMDKTPQRPAFEVNWPREI